MLIINNHINNSSSTQRVQWVRLKAWREEIKWIKARQSTYAGRRIQNAWLHKEVMLRVIHKLDRQTLLLLVTVLAPRKLSWIRTLHTYKERWYQIRGRPASNVGQWCPSKRFRIQTRSTRRHPFKTHSQARPLRKNLDLYIVRGQKQQCVAK
jgi:hypothetical protein